MQLLGSPAFRMLAVVLALLLSAWAISSDPAGTSNAAVRTSARSRPAGPPPDLIRSGRLT
jgi:hypothetical protein